jgi:hypothetical protein
MFTEPLPSNGYMRHNNEYVPDNKVNTIRTKVTNCISRILAEKLTVIHPVELIQQWLQNPMVWDLVLSPCNTVQELTHRVDFEFSRQWRREVWFSGL